MNNRTTESPHLHKRMRASYRDRVPAGLQEFREGADLSEQVEINVPRKRDLRVRRGGDAL